MRLPFLKHVLDSVSALSHPRRIVLLGSSSLLPTAPQLGEPGQPLEFSNDADLLLDPVNQEMANMLMEAVGSGSLFEKQNGYHADILRPQTIETLPTGWETRLHPVSGYDHVFTLDPYDLAIVKLMIGRKKDLDLLRALLALKIIAPDRLRRHYQTIPLNENESFAIGRNLPTLLLGFESG
ncbi:MAG: hypothetical protein HY360_08740 [Verrucomicrobia bacterium]|nr:hypothetical protein [Verrucomicrobiota bacterium]